MVYTDQERTMLLNKIIELKLPHFTRDWVFFKLLFETGRRNTETRMTRLQDLDIDHNKWFIPKEHNKVKRDRLVLISDDMAFILRQYIKEYQSWFRTNENGETYIFYSARDKGNKNNTPYFYPYIRFHRYLEAAGLGRIACVDSRGHKLRQYRIHDVRRTFTNEVIEFGRRMGLNIFEMARLTDHSDINTLNKHYAEISTIALQNEFNNDRKRKK